jgi:hypothetical protein
MDIETSSYVRCGPTKDFPCGELCLFEAQKENCTSGNLQLKLSWFVRRGRERHTRINCRDRCGFSEDEIPTIRSLKSFFSPKIPDSTSFLRMAFPDFPPR